jgi:hydroxymethylpyrimidine pyrophosphatase-like HAD family hydrolase
MNIFIKRRFCILFVFALLLLAGCKKEMPSDFSFYAEFGLARSIKVNSSTGTYIFNPGNKQDSVIMKLNFSKQELEKIWKLIYRNKLTEFDSYYIPKDKYQVSPDESYFLQYTINGTNYEIKWEIYTSAKDLKSKKLRSIFTKIAEIASKDPNIAKLKYSFEPY